MKKYLIAFLLLIAGASNAHAELMDDVRRDLSLTVQGGLNYVGENTVGLRQADDTWTLSGRLEKPVYKELSVGAEFDYFGRKYYPLALDPKGHLGSLTGYGFMGNLIFRPKVNEKFSPYIIGGIGYYFWDFYENPYLQDNKIEVTLDPSIATKIGIGLDYKLSANWSINAEVNYFATEIPKYAHDHLNNSESHILGDKVLGNESWNFLAGLVYRF